MASIRNTSPKPPVNQQWSSYTWNRAHYNNDYTWREMNYQPYMRPLYAEIASLIDAYKRCIATGNDFATKHLERLENIQRNYLPSGSGIYSGCKIDIDGSTGDKVVITFGYHCMDDNGMCAGWIDYKVTIKPSLMFKYDLKVTGRDYHGNKEYFYQLFDCLRDEVDIKTL